MTTWMMPLEEILDLPSVDSDGFYRHTTTDAKMVGETVRDTVYDEHFFGNHHERIREQMIKDGINAVPIHVDLAENMITAYKARVPERLYGCLAQGNGHHRIMIAWEAGFTHMLVTDVKAESDAGPEVTTAERESIKKITGWS